MKKFIIICGLLGTFTSCDKKLEPKEALIEYHEGARTLDVMRIRKVLPKDVTEERIKQIFVYLPFVPDIDKKVEWVKDSFISQDTVIVIARRVGNNDYFLKRKFWKEDGRWVCEF
jgi:hypothetical protein